MTDEPDNPITRFRPWLRSKRKTYQKAYFTSLYPKELRIQWRKEVYGELFNEEEHSIFNSQSELRDELGLAMSTLTAIFDQEHPEHDFYEALEIEPNHIELWRKIEDDLYSLIDSVMDLNKEKYDENENEEI